jgi:undecaprenyl-diphosphatase
MLPISSSGHVAIVPQLLRWPYAELEPELRKSFEVAVHAGSAAALLLRPRTGLARWPGLGALLLSTLPPAAVGLALERPIERRCGGVRSVAIAQVAAGAALALADRAPEARTRPAPRDHLLVGLAQSAALVPGVSRGGAALTAARAAGLTRRASARLSLGAALPITAGAALLKSVRALQGGVPDEHRNAFALGAGAAFASALVSAPLAARLEEAHTFAPFGAYRICLGLLALSAGERD